MKKLDRRLLRLIKSSLGQVVAVSLILVVGLMTYTAFKISAINLETTIDEYYEITNFADMYIEGINFSQHRVSSLVGSDGITDAEGRIVRDVPFITDEDENIAIRVVSFKEDSNINNIYKLDGKVPLRNKKQGAVIKQFADARNILVGDTIRLQISGKEYEIEITAIIESPEYIYAIKNEQTLLPDSKEFGVVFLEEEFSKGAFNTNLYNEIALRVSDDVNLEILEDKLDRRLSRFGIKRIIKRENQLSNRMISEEVKQLKAMAKVVPVLFLSIAGLILFAMISRIVKKDRSIIGVMKALGYSKYQIVLHYVKYTLLIGFVGSIIGSNIGILMAGGMTRLYLMYFHIPILRANYYIRYVFISIILACIFCIGAGILGSMGVLRIMPSESMRPPAPKNGRRILLERVGFIWKRLSFSLKMVFRNIFRSKKRFAFTLIGVSMSFGMMLMSFYQFSTVFGIFEKHYGEYLRMDYNVKFTKPMNERVMTEIKNLVRTDDLEGYIEFPFELEYRWKNKVVNIIGIEEGSNFYGFKNQSDNKTDILLSGITITENLSNYLEVGIGDTIKINSFLPYRDDISLKVNNIVKQGLGINAYMHIDDMQRLLLDKEAITGIYIDSNDDIKKKLKGVDNIESVQTLADIRNLFMQFMQMTYISIATMVFFSGLLGFAVVYNSTVIGISERKQEFSSLRVMGFTRKEIFKILLKENLILTIIGIIVGIPVGIGFIIGIRNAFSNDLFTVSGPIEFSAYLYAGIYTTIFVVIAQLFTLRKINRLNFIDALKNRVS